MALLEIDNLAVDFVSDTGRVRVVDGVSLRLEAGRTLCLVGESGSGKSVTALSIARLLQTPPAVYAGGEIRLEGRNVFTLNQRELCAVRGGMVGYVFQEPAASLNPVMRVGRQIEESLLLHRPGCDPGQEVIRLLKLCGIPAPELRARDFPFQLSGGMQQRVMIAMALAAQPRLLVADEPTTALDVTIQAQILDLLRDLQRQLGMAILLITHNLAIVDGMSDDLAVMYAGQIVELGPTAAVLRKPLHPYTAALIQSVPRLQAGARRLTAIPGTVPQPGQYSAGCRFYPRCPQARPPCDTQPPELREVKPGRWVRSWYVAGEESGVAP